MFEYLTDIICQAQTNELFNPVFNKFKSGGETHMCALLNVYETCYVPM